MKISCFGSANIQGTLKFSFSALSMMEAINDFNKWPTGSLLKVKSFGIGVSAEHIKALHESWLTKTSEVILQEIIKEQFCVHWFQDQWYYKGSIHSEQDIVSGQYLQ